MFIRPPKPAPRVRTRTSILRRTIRPMLLLSATVTIVFIFIVFLVTRSMLTQRMFSEVSAVAGSAEDAIEDSISDARQRVSLLASHEDIRRVASRDLPIDRFHRLFQEVQSDDPSVQGLSLIDADGRVIAASGKPMEVDASRARSLHLGIDRHGWTHYDIVSPIRSHERTLGFLAVRYGTSELLSRVVSALPSIGSSAQLMLGVERDGQLLLLQPKDRNGNAYTLELGGAEEQLRLDLPLARALAGQEGVGEAEDHRGHTVLGAYRSLPALGGGLVVQIDRSDALASVRRLSAILGAVGLVLLAFATFLAYMLSRDLTRPIRDLAKKVRELGPEQWEYNAKLQTGDEIELLDRTVADLTDRLRRVYDDLESEVVRRGTELDEQYAFERAVLDALQHGVVATDAHGNISAVNPAAVSLLGWTAREMLGKTAESLLTVTAGDAHTPLPVQPVRHCLSSKRVFRPKPGGRLGIRCKDETILPVMLLAAPLVRDRKAFGAVLVFQDMRDERKMDELKSEFVTLASHQLRTPLSILRWHMDILKEEDGFTQTQAQSLQEMEHATGRMTHLLNALLQVVQLEGGSITPNAAPIDVRTIVKEMVEEIQPLFASRKLHCEEVLPAKPVMLKTDEALLRVVLQNLLTNALKYSREKGTVTVSVAKAKNAVCLKVADQGLGIPKKDQSFLFEKFFRARNVQKTDTDGSGLGLYIIKMIVESLHGRISFQSREGEGTTFMVRFPLSIPSRS